MTSHELINGSSLVIRDLAEFPEDLFRRLFIGSLLFGPGDELLPVMLDEFFVVLPPEGAAQPIRLARGKTGHVDGELVHLVLEKDNAEGPFQRPLL